MVGNLISLLDKGRKQKPEKKVPLKYGLTNCLLLLFLKNNINKDKLSELSTGLFLPNMSLVLVMLSQMVLQRRVLDKSSTTMRTQVGTLTRVLSASN